jgi:uncharacterized membrane protein YfcA
VLTAVPEGVIKATLGVIIVAFSLYCLFSRRQLALKPERLAWAFGFCAGVLRGACGMHGPPLVVYGALRHWPPQQFRATVQGYFLPASLLVIGGYWLAGLWVAAVAHYYLWSLPITLMAIFLGRVIHHRLDGRRFVRFVHAGLIGV